MLRAITDPCTCVGVTYLEMQSLTKLVAARLTQELTGDETLEAAKCRAREVAEELYVDNAK